MDLRFNPLAHKRSLESRQRRDTHKHLLDFSYHDNIIKEIVCTRYAILMTEAELKKKYDYLLAGNILSFECGEVLVDSLGRGTFQKVVEVNH